MKRVEKFKDKRRKSYWTGIVITLGALFIVGFSVTVSILVLRENKQIKDFISNYDKTEQVYNLQQDFLKKF